MCTKFFSIKDLERFTVFNLFYLYFTFQQKLWKKKYDFSKANKVIREVTKNTQQKQKNNLSPADQLSTKDDNKSCDKCGVESETNSTNLKTSELSDSTNKDGHVSDKPVERIPENRSPKQNNTSNSNQSDKCDSHNSMTINVEETCSSSGAITDEGEIRLRSEEKKMVRIITFFVHLYLVYD